ncbi:MAG: YjeF-related protein [Candidatus Krumholzibacteriota bacterium]|nr:YjeF-related protein [Candidatus Krumholzibacteriota bacterium]
MDVLTNARMRKIDEETIARFCPGLELMERAGRKVTEYILERFPEKGFKAAVFVGPGNNGGDALVVARRFAEAGRACTVLYLAAPESFTMDTLKNYQRLQDKAKSYPHLKELNLTRSDWMNLVGKELVDSSLIVDGLFGTGLARPLEDRALGVVRMINESGVPAVSIDTPSGVNGDTGEVLGDAVRAQSTVTMGYPKLGLLFHPGKERVGHLVTADLGFPDEALQVHSMGIYLNDRAEAARRLPARKEDAHKYECGTALLIAGSRMYTGAVLLAAEAVLRSGCGMVYCAVPASIRDLVEPELREAITIAVPETEDGTVAPGAWPALQSYVEKADVLVVGPGMSRNPDTTRFVLDVLDKSPKPLVIDADGLNALEGNAKALSGRRVPIVITPHSGELSKLVGGEIPKTPLDKIEATREIARSLGITLVHKGAPTLIASPGGEVWVNYNGTSALAKAGTGDVLTGLIGGFFAQGGSPVDAACVGCCLHGRAGEIAARARGVRGVIAGDLLKYLGEPLIELEAAARKK